MMKLNTIIFVKLFYLDKDKRQVTKFLDTCQ